LRPVSIRRAAWDGRSHPLPGAEHVRDDASASPRIVRGDDCGSTLQIWRASTQVRR
jgi:hypothetical protein